MLRSFQRRLDALRKEISAEVERTKPVLFSLTLFNGEKKELSPVEAIDLAFGSGLGTICSVETERPEYAEMAGVLNAVFGEQNKTERKHTL